MDEQTEHPESQLEQESESKQFNPKRAVIGGLILLIVFSGCGWGILRFVSGVPDYVTMTGRLVMLAHLSTLYGSDGEVSLGETIRNMPEHQRKELVEDFVDDLFARGWHIRATSDWDEYARKIIMALQKKK